MVSVFQRKLLKEWKNIQTQRAQNSVNNLGYRSEAKFKWYIKPQDSNLHVWHIVLYDLYYSQELYFVLYIGKLKNVCYTQSELDDITASNNTISNGEDFDIILRCLTPNHVLPMNRNVSLTHFRYILLKQGLYAFTENLWDMLFSQNLKSSDNINSIIRCWNRLMNKSFKVHFPELIGKLDYGDYKLFKEYTKKNNYNNDKSINIQSIISSDRSKYTIACDDSRAFWTSSNKRKLNHLNGEDQDEVDDTNNERINNTNSTFNCHIKKSKL